MHLNDLAHYSICNDLELALFALLFVVSLTVLLVASDWFIGAAEKIGAYMGIPSFIIGVTIVAFGTSLPELATSIASVFSGSSEIVVGNVIGSNITNILLVLGMSAFVTKKLNIDFDVMDIDMPLLFGSAFLLYFALSDLYFSFTEALIFILGLVIFLLNSFNAETEEEEEKGEKPTAKTYIMLVVGAALVYFGATYTIYAMEQISASFGIPQHIIALGAVALGTSLPEVVVSVKAAQAGRHGIAIGNVLGSNMFNTFAVMGIPSFFGNLAIPEDTLTFSLPYMVACTILFGLMCLTKKVSRWEGAMLLVFYVFFIVQLVDQV